MSEPGERDELSLLHPALGFFHESALFRGENIVGIDHAAGLDARAIFLFRERDKIPFSGADDTIADCG